MPLPVLELDHKKSLVWSIRAPSQDKRDLLGKFTEAVKLDGLDVCRVVIGFAEAYLEARARNNKGARLETLNGVTNIIQHNLFTYEVSRPRREPFTLDCIKPEYRKTLASVVFDYYVLARARDLNREFSFRDFLELDYGHFRRVMARLKRKGKILRIPERTIPAFYILNERARLK